MVKRALSRWSHRGHPVFVAGLLLEDDFGSLRVVEVVKELGLITCVRSEFCQGGKTPQLAEAQVMFASALSTWKKRFRTEYRQKWEEKSKG